MRRVSRAGVALLALAAGAAADLAVHRDGSVLERKELAVRVADGVLVNGKKELPLDDFYLVEKADGTLLWAADLTARLRGYELLAQDEMQEEAAKLAVAAIKAKDIPLARELLDRAQRYGLWGKKAGGIERRIDALARRRNVKPTSKAAQVRERAGRIKWLHAELLVVRARREMAAGGPHGLALLRQALRESPECTGARKLLAEVAPKGYGFGKARAWLYWKLDVEERGASFVGNETALLRRARSAWRRDLFGVDAGPILMVTPVLDSELVGRCMAFGKLTCRVLRELFRGLPVHNPKPAPMALFLYSSKDEYVKNAGRVSIENPAFLEWTAGHYSPDERVSRFYWHKDRDAERRLVGTCVHELTHQWLRERNPVYSRAETVIGPMTPGFWIVEGFASFMEEGSYDIDTGKWSLFDPRSRSLDVIVSLRRKRGALLDWERVYALDQTQFARLSHEPELKITRRWSLGYEKLSESRVFYEQAAATCQYLFHAAGGKHRDALLRYIVAFYTYKPAELDIRRAFGMSDAELGSRVEKFAQAVAAGWQPR